jgi:hypothetical protein
MTGYEALSVVPDGDGYVLGSRYTGDFVAVPAIGGDVVRWLQAGASVEECAARAEERMGEPVDVAGFIAGLTSAGLLPPAGPAAPVEAPPAREVRPWARRAGALLFGRVGLAVQAVLTAFAIGALIAVPQVRPRYSDVFVSRVPLLSMLAIAVFGTATALLHEGGHVLAASARGVRSRVSMSRRLVSLVYQTDLTRLWSVPRRARVVPLLAGLAVDSALIGVLVLLELTVVRGGLALGIVRALVFVNATALLFQLEVYMRTDLYALFVVATGCRNLWATKGAVARRAIRRASAADLTQIADAGPREVFWARIYLCLYVPGVLWTVWYFAVFAVPAIRGLLAMCFDAVSAHGIVSGLGAAGVVAAALTLASLGFVLWGLLRTAARVARQVVSP